MNSQGQLSFSLLAVLCLACGRSSSTGPESHPPSEPENHPPSGSVTAPSDGAVFFLGDTVEIDVTASDDDGSVVAVRFYANGEHLATDWAAPYSFTWYTYDTGIGDYVVRATFVDDRGALGSDEVAVRVRWRYYQPEQLADGWEVSSIWEEAFDTLALYNMMDGVHFGDYEFMHGVLIVRNGKLVFEEYFGGFARDSLQHFQSTTKSITSALVGIAIDRGEIGSVTEPLFDYLPQYARLRDAEKDRITIEHCLMMAAGLEWNEHSVPYSDPDNDNSVGNRSDDYVAYVLSKPVVHEPGTQWYYNSGCSMTLGAILLNATGILADEYADRYLFGPLGISRHYWMVMGGGHLATHGGLFLRMRDMAKFGQLFLQGGAWDGQQVISEEWVAESTRPRMAAEGGTQYGYQWWFLVADGYDVPIAAGGGGQYIFLVPALDMVVVTAANPRNVGDQEQRVVSLFLNHILPAALPAWPRE